MSILDNKRVCKILKRLQSTSEPISGEKLAFELGVTSRTVRSDIKKLSEYLKEYGARVNSTTGVGYSLEIYDRALFKELEEKLNESPNKNNNKKFNLIPTDPADREKYIISKLLINSLSSRYMINSYDLAEELFISLSTLKKDISNINNKLQSFNLKVENSQTRGIYIKGEEKDIRYCISDYIFKNADVTNEEEATFYNEMFSKELMEKIRKILMDVFCEFDIHLTDVSFKNILVHVLIMVKRHQYKHKTVFDDSLITEFEKNENYKVAKAIIERIEKSINVDLKEEVYYLTQHLQVSKKFLFEKAEDGNEYSEVIKNIVDAIKNKFGIDLEDDKQLEKGLAMHLNVAIRRMKFNMNIRNDFLLSIKKYYPLAFELAIVASDILEKEYTVDINENEIGLLAIHFGAALERRGINSKEKTKGVTIVCGFGVSTAILIKEKLLRLFKNRINVLNVTSAQDFNEKMLEESDVVITTVPIKKYSSRKIIQVPLNLGFSHIQKIEDIMLEEEKNKIDYSKILKEELFFKNLSANNKNDVIETITNKMLELGFIDQKGKKSVYEREEMATTELGSFVALPHTINQNDDKSVVGIAVLEKPILWNQEKVQVVLLLNISKTFVNEWEHIFRNLYNYLIEKSNVTKLVKGMDYKTFINELIENNDENE